MAKANQTDQASAGRTRTRYASRKRRVRWPLIALIVGLHAIVLYALAQALVPDFTSSIEREVVAAFDISAPEPSPEPSPPPPENQAEPDEGAQGAPGKKAVAEQVKAPPATVIKPKPKPRATSTGSAKTSGAREAGAGTGAAGQGDGTGSGNSGNGRGGIAVTKPEHISGAINNARDYPTPPGGRQARKGTEVIVRVIVGTNGRARNCSVYRASPDAEADRITCQLVEKRLSFKPAKDANGNPVDAPFYWRQRWF